MTNKENAGLAARPLPTSGHVRLTDRCLVAVSGDNADRFLQGQFSQHIDEVTSSHAPRAAACNPKGRTYCLTRMARTDDAVLMELPVALCERTLNHLRKYLMLFRNTTMAPLASGAIWGLVGDRIARHLAGDAVQKLTRPGDAVSVEHGLLIRSESYAADVPRYQLWQTGGGGLDVADEPEISLADWQAGDLAAGVPVMNETSWEAFVPQMLNWQHLGGLHFNKGCYTGQEVIARMHFLGQLKKSLFRFRAPAPVEIGASVMSGDRLVGDVLNQVTFTDGTAEILAVVRHDAGTQSLNVDGHALEPLPLPYAVPEQQSPEPTDT